MQKHLKTLLIIMIIWIFWWTSQIIFDVLYSTQQESYLAIDQGNRIKNIASSGGYFEQHVDLFTSSKPTPLESNTLSKFQDTCKYGQGNCNAFFWQDMLSSFRWITAIQHIAQEVNTNEPSDITNRFASLTDIKPRRYYPYILLQYLGNPSLETDDKEHAKIARDNVIALGEKGIGYYCDSNTIAAINTLNYTSFIKALETKDPQYRYPCTQWWELAHTLAFNYYYYLWDSEKASLYYKIASFHDDVPLITSSMPALIQWKDGNNKTSAYLRYDQFSSAANKYNNKENLNPDEISSLESSMDKSIKKMVSEYSLYILWQASTLAQEKWVEESCYHKLSCLESQSYIQNIIISTEKQCKNNKIDCDIINYGKKNKWITDKKLNYYDKNTSLDYKRNIDKNLWNIWSTME